MSSADGITGAKIVEEVTAEAGDWFKLAGLTCGVGGADKLILVGEQGVEVEDVFAAVAGEVAGGLCAGGRVVRATR